MDESLEYDLERDLEQADAMEDAAGADESDIILATISNVSSTGVTILIDGDEEVSSKEYKVNAAQRFAVGDRVKFRKNSGTYLVEYVVGSPMSRYPIPSGGSDGQVLTKDGTTAYAVKWATAPHGLPAGGTANQVLAKSSNADYAVSWADLPHGLPTGGTANQVLAKNSGTNYDVKWVTMESSHGIPSGGTTGQYLMKSSNTNYAVEWSSAPATDRLTSSAKHVIYNGSALYADATSSLGSSSYYWNGCYLSGAIRLGNSAYNSTLGFFGTTPQSQQRVSSSATLSTLISALQKYGLIGS